MSQLCKHYIEATKAVYKQDIFVPAGQQQKFYAREKIIIAKGITPRDYAYRLTKHLQWWVKQRKFRNLPINTFLGDWAMRIYLNELDEKTERLSLCAEDNLILIQEEYRVLLYAYVNDIEYDEAASTLSLLMGDVWSNSTYKQRHLARQQALKQLEVCSGYLSVQQSISDEADIISSQSSIRL